VQQFDASGHAETFKYTKDKIKADHQDKIKAAYKIDAETAVRLQRKDFLSDPETIALQAYEMRMKLGLQHDAELNEEHFDIDLGQLIRFNAFLGRFKQSQDKAKDLAVSRYSEAMGKVYKLAFDGVLMQPNAVFTETGAKLLIQQIAKYRLLLAAIGAIPTRFGAPSWKPSAYSARDLNEILKHIGIKNKYIRNPFKPRLKRKLSVEMPHNLYIRIGVSQQITDEYAYKIDAENFAVMQQLCDSLFNASEQQIMPEDMQQLADAVASVEKPDFVSDVVSLDDVQINIEPIALVTAATKQQLNIKPSNDAVFDVMQQLTRSDLTLDDLHRLRSYAEQIPKQRYATGGVQQVSELGLINSMISSGALQFSLSII
jgi:putative DNA primase/helicase